MTKLNLHQANLKASRLALHLLILSQVLVYPQVPKQARVILRAPIRSTTPVLPTIQALKAPHLGLNLLSRWYLLALYHHV